MARVSFLDRVHPNRMRSKLIAWPLAAEDGSPALEAPRVRVRVLGAHELEAADLATADHFRKAKQKVDPRDDAFTAREHIELVWRAFADEDGQPLTPTADDLAKEPSEFITPLYAEWAMFQREVAVPTLKQGDLDAIIEELKKNTRSVLLDALPSIWLRQLITTSVDRPVTSTTPSESGS